MIVVVSIFSKDFSGPYSSTHDSFDKVRMTNNTLLSNNHYKYPPEKNDIKYMSTFS